MGLFSKLFLARTT